MSQRIKVSVVDDAAGSLRDIYCDPLGSGGGDALRKCFNAMHGDERTGALLELVEMALRDAVKFATLPEGERTERRTEEVIVFGEIALSALRGEIQRRAR